MPSIRGRGAQVASAQAGAPQFIMRAGFGEAALANMSKGKAYLIFLRECRNVASRDNTFAIFLQEVVTKVAHLNVEAFVLSGSHALDRCPTIFDGGSLRRGGVGTVCTRVRRILWFWENLAKLPRRTKGSHSCCQKS